MLIPPEAEPVIPANVVTVIASLTNGFGIFSRLAAIAVNPGNRAITAPKPYSDAVFNEASNAPATAALLPSAKLRNTLLNANTNTVKIPVISASSTAQIATSLPLSTTIGLAPSEMVNSLP